MNRITEITRRDIFDVLRVRGTDWAGRLDEVEFLSRIFDLSSFESDDERFDNAAEDIEQHRINNDDWPDDWIFSDERFDLLDCEDKVFLKFISEIIHPVVRSDQTEVKELLNDFNKLLDTDGFEIYEVKRVSGHPVFSWRSKTPTPMDSSAAITEFTRLPDFWKEGCLRIFISHVSANKVQAKELKDCLGEYQISAFVAHEDIEPTREWQDEIELALKTMDAFVAYITPGFHESNWTDQETGFAVCRDVFMIPIRVGIDPYGFIGKRQGLQGLSQTMSILSAKIFSLLLKENRTSHKMAEALVNRFEKSESFANAEANMKLLEMVESLNEKQIARIRNAVEMNSQVKRCWYVRDNMNNFVKEARKKLAMNPT